MKIRNFSIVASLSAAALVLASNGVQAQNLRFDFGVPPYGSDPVSGVVGSGTKVQSTSTATLGSAQGRVNAVGASLTAAGISGSQVVGGNTVNVDPGAASLALEVINSPAGADIPAVATFVGALGGSDAAQKLARSLQGLRGGDGSINPVVLSGAVSSYNNYLRYIIDASQITEKPSSQLESFIGSLPAGQKATQVILGKLVEAAR